MRGAGGTVSCSFCYPGEGVHRKCMEVDIYENPFNNFNLLMFSLTCLC